MGVVFFSNHSTVFIDFSTTIFPDFLVWMKQNVTKGGNDELLFSPGTTTIRPGVLVLVNDTDWELLDQTDCKVFIYLFSFLFFLSWICLLMCFV